MFRLLTKLILGTSLLAAFFPPGIPSVAPFPVSGTKVDGYVPTVQADLTVAWEAQSGGGGLTIDGTIGDGDTVSYDGTDSVYVPRHDRENVKDFIGGIRASGSSAQVTATATSGNASITTSDGTSWAEGYGAALVGGGSAHGISAPSNCFAIPRTVYQTAPLSAATVAPVTFTVDQTNDTILLPVAIDYRVALAVAEGQGLRLSTTGTLPTHSGGTLAEATTYYAHHLPETTTVAMAGTPTGGTYRLYSYYQVRNQCFHVQEDPLLYVDLVYNAGVEVQTVAISGTPTSGSYTLTLSGYGTTGSIAYNADETVVQAALRAITGLSRVVVTKTGSSPNYTHTIVFDGVNGNIAQMTNTDSTSGGSHLITNATASNGTTTSPETALRTLEGCSQITVAQTGSSPNFTHTITWTGVPGRQSIIYDLAKLTGGTPQCTVTSTRSGGIQLYDTQANAIAAGGTGKFDLTGAGSSTNYVSVYGSKTYYFQASALSGNGGTTAAASEFTTALGPHECDENQQVCVVFDKPTSAEGYAIYGDTSSGKKLLTTCDQITNIRRVTCQAGGFTNFEYGDLGKTLTDGSSTGTIQCFDNTTRNVWVATSSTFPTNGATLTTTSGTGGGTQTGASVNAFAWIYNGKRFKREYNYYPSLARRGGEKCYPGQVMEFNGNLYTCVDVQGNRRTAPEIAFTINTTTNVLTLASTTSAQTNAKPVYLRSSVSLPTISGGTLLQENVVYYTRWASGTTCTLHPTANDATNNTNTIDLTADNLGTYYMLDCPSFGTSLGSYTTDGWVTWRRQDQTYPTTPPSSAIADIFLATVVSVSTNTVVLSAGPTTSVTSQLLLHDDYPAVLAHHNACNSATAKTRLLYFPGGKNAEYQFVTKKNDSRMFNSAYGGGLAYYMFRWGVLSDEWIPVTWEADPGTRLILASLDNSADLNDGTDTTVYMHTFGRCAPTFRGVKLCHWPQGVPVAERPDAINRITVYNSDTDSTAGSGINTGSRVSGPRFYNGGFYAFASTAGDTWQSNEATGDVFQDWEMFYGGSNHNLGVYVNGGDFLRCYFYGIRAERSQMFYQDAEEGFSINLDHCYFEGSRKDGIALRYSEARVTNSKFVDCTKIFARESCKSLVLDNCDLYETDIIPNNSSNAFDDIRISNMRMVDSELTTQGYSTNANIAGVQMLLTPHPRRYTGTSTACTLGATDQNITDVTIDNRAWQLDYRSVLFDGNGSSHFTRVKVTRSKGDWAAFTTAGTGPKWWTECEFWSQSGGGAGPCLCQHTGDGYWNKCKFAGLTGNPLGSTGYDFNSGGRTTFDACENAAFDIIVNSGITGKVVMRNCDWKGGTVAFYENGTIIEGNNFANEPFISATLLATSRNKVADSLTKAVTLSASQNNYTWPTICDTILVDANAAYSITGIVPRAKGTIVKIVNVDSSDVLTIAHGSASSSAANKININVGSDLALGSLDGKELICTENATMGWSEN